MDLRDSMWRKSSYSNASGGHCVEVADTVSRGAAVRDSRHPTLSHLAFPSAEWSAFVREVKDGHL